jgi:hypothetical protein
VTKWLTRYVKVPRKKVGSVLHLYPYDYSPAFATGLRKYVAAKMQAEAEAAAGAAAAPEESDEDEEGSNRGGQAGGPAAE